MHMPGVPAESRDPPPKYPSAREEHAAGPWNSPGGTAAASLADPGQSKAWRRRLSPPNQDHGRLAAGGLN